MCSSDLVNDYTDWMFNVTANYERTFDSHTFGIMAGVEGQSKEMEYMYARRQNYVSGAKAELSLGSAEGMENEGYSWKETRFLSAARSRAFAIFLRLNWGCDMNGAINFTATFSHGVEWGWPIAVYLLLAGTAKIGRASCRERV